MHGPMLLLRQGTFASCSGFWFTGIDSEYGNGDGDLSVFTMKLDGIVAVG